MMHPKGIQLFVAATLAGVATATVYAAENGLDPVAYFKLRTEAQRATVAKDYAAAAKAYEQLTRAYDGDGWVWFNLGGCSNRLERWAPAIAAYRKAYALGFWTRAEVAHEIAGCHARAGATDSALAWIERSLALGYEDRAELAEQDEFASLRSNARFQKLAGTLPSGRWTRETGWRLDLDYLIAEVKRYHFVYRSAPLPAEFESRAEDLRRRIPQLSDVAVMLEMQRLMALLGDGHSTLYPMPTEHVPLRQVPLQFHVFADGLFVVDAPADQSQWIGARIERIGGVAADEALRRVEPFVSRDNANGLRVIAPYFLRSTSFLHAAGILPDDSRLPLAGKAQDGKPIEGAVPSEEPGAHAHGHLPKLCPPRFAGAPAAPAYLEHAGDAFRFDSMLADSLVYVQFNQVTDTPSESLRQFATRLRQELDGKPVKTLVVDVRLNNGGNGDLLAPLVRTLVRFETAGQGRRLFVITSPYTFSAAQYFIAQLDRLTGALFVGEPAGSRPNFIGEDTGLLLPWSQVRGSISSRAHRVSSSDERVWIAPEMPVAMTGADWLAGRDAAMGALLELVRGR